MTAPTTYRQGCGTYLGLRLHQVADERPCAQCLIGEAVRALELEAIPRRPSKANPFGITPERAAANRAELEAELSRLDASGVTGSRTHGRAA